MYNVLKFLIVGVLPLISILPFIIINLDKKDKNFGICVLLSLFVIMMFPFIPVNADNSVIVIIVLSIVIEMFIIAIATYASIKKDETDGYAWLFALFIVIALINYTTFIVIHNNYQ